MIFKAAAAVRAVFDVDVEDPFEQPGPTHARRRALRGRDRMRARWHALAEWERFYCATSRWAPARHGSGSDEARARHQGRQALAMKSLTVRIPRYAPGRFLPNKMRA